MKVKSESEDTQPYPTVSEPMDCRLPGSSIHGILQARILEWVAIAFSEPQSLTKRIKPKDITLSVSFSEEGRDTNQVRF